MFVHVFDTIAVTNLPATRLVGLIYLPAALATIGTWSRTTAARAWLASFLWVAILGVAFGFLWPWPDSTGARPFTLTAPGKTIVQLIRMLGDISLTVFLTEELRKRGTALYLTRAVLAGAITTAAVGILEAATHFDFYRTITSIVRDYVVDRSRGLSFEPRGLGMACAYAIVILLLGQRRILKWWITALFIALAAMALTYSASAVALLVAMIGAVWLVFGGRMRMTTIGIGLLAVGALAALASFFPERAEAGRAHLRARLEVTERTGEEVPANLGEEIAFRLDVFDGSAMLFLLRNPKYAVTGTGPGLVALPASYTVPPGIYSQIWPPTKGINSPPSHGLLLELANGGILGALLWIIQAAACWHSLRLLSRHRKLPAQFDDWTVAKCVFLIGTVGYLVQISVTPLWNLFLAFGWAASLTVADARRAARVREQVQARQEMLSAPAAG